MRTTPWSGLPPFAHPVARTATIGRLMEESEPRESRPAKREYRNTVGSIIGWAILRAAAFIAVSLFLFDYLRASNYSFWWMMTAALFYPVVLYPAQVQYRLYKEETKAVMTGTLCSSCKYFEPTGVMCSRLDEHVTEEYIACDGELWEPRSFEDD
jgi:hypothetical protein